MCQVSYKHIRIMMSLPKVCLRIFLISCLQVKLIQAQAFEFNQNPKAIHEAQDARASLASLDIGASFRNKRDNVDASEHAKLSLDSSLDSAADSVAAAAESVVAGMEAEEAMRALDGENKIHVSGSNTVGKEIENDEPEPYISENMTSIEGDNAFLSFLQKHKDGELQKLMTESSELGKELHLIFDILAKRESQLIDEMERLKSALTGAVSVLKNSPSIPNFSKRYRREHVNFHEPPYKACVYIESLPNQDVNPEDGDIQYPPEPIIREFIPDQRYSNGDADYYAHSSQITNNPNLHQNHLGTGDDIDLSKVYWLKLPDNLSDVSAHQKVEALFGEVRGEGKDVLIIPVSREFTSSHQVSQGFRKALGLHTGPQPQRSRKTRTMPIEVKQIKL